MVFHAAESTRRFLSPTFSVLFILRGVAVAEVVKTRQTELRTRRQSAVGLLTIWPTISADLAFALLFLFFFFFLRGLPQIASLTLTKESGKLKLNFIGRYEQTQAIIGMAALIQINNQHQREVKHRFDHAGDPSTELKESEMELWITEMKRGFLLFFTPYSNSSSFLLLLLVC